MYFLKSNWQHSSALLTERDYVTFGSLLSQIRLSIVCIYVCMYMYVCTGWAKNRTVLCKFVAPVYVDIE